MMPACSSTHLGKNKKLMEIPKPESNLMDCKSKAKEMDTCNNTKRRNTGFKQESCTRNKFSRYQSIKKWSYYTTNGKGAA